MNGNNTSFEDNRGIREKINNIRQKALKKRKKYNLEKINLPISHWIKGDRLINGIGKEFTIILRSRGCSWGLSEYGGCSMCGYYLDAINEDVSTTQLINQFDFAYNNKINEINNDPKNYICKIYNSGSFLDDNEIPQEVRTYIYKKIAKVEKIKEFVIESRLEYINAEKLEEIREFFGKKYLEIAIGLETTDDYIRNIYINKGVLYNSFIRSINLLKEYNIGVRVYLLLKPPFLNEQGAIDDCSNSIKKLVDLNVNSISINPLNIQKGTFVEYLWFQNRYRPPWFYSLFKCLKKAITQDNLNYIRILSDPSGAGTKRGIHNCLKKECENSARDRLQNFVFTQNLSELDRIENECNCKKRYQLTKNYF